jgi:hypothetical protein
MLAVTRPISATNDELPSSKRVQITVASGTALPLLFKFGFGGGRFGSPGSTLGLLTHALCRI